MAGFPFPRAAEAGPQPPPVNWPAVEYTAERHCNLKFCRFNQGRSLKLTCIHRVTQSPQPTELYINYSIQHYWLPYLCRNVERLGMGCPPVRQILETVKVKTHKSYQNRLCTVDPRLSGPNGTGPCPDN